MKTVQILSQKSPWARACLFVFVVIISSGFLYSAIGASNSSVLAHDLYTLTEDTTLEAHENSKDRPSHEHADVNHVNVFIPSSDSSLASLMVGVLASTISASPKPVQYFKIASSPSQAPPRLA